MDHRKDNNINSGTFLKRTINKIKSKYCSIQDIPRYTILKSIPHRRVVNKNNGAEEIFDLYQLGIFATNDSIFSSLSKAKENEVEEIVELVELQPNAEYIPHYHEHSCALIYIIVGSGILWLGDECIEYSSKKRIMIPAGILHGFKTINRTLFLSIQSPPILDPKTGYVDLHHK